MIDVPLSRTEIEILEIVGRVRMRESSKHGKDATQNTGSTSEEKNISGAVSEFAVAKYWNLAFDLDCTFKKGRAVDLVLHSGKTIDVKCCERHGTGALNAVGWSDTKFADLFILTEYHRENRGHFVRIVGWIPRDIFIDNRNKKSGQNTGVPFYSLPRSCIYAIIPKIVPEGSPI
jgi:hypothetical protein